MRNRSPVLKLFFPWALYLLSGLFFIAGGVATLGFEPWMALSLLPVGAIFTLIGVAVGVSPMRTLFEGRSELVGFVTEKTITEEVTAGGTVVERPNIRVGGELYDVSYGIYSWVEEGDEAVVTFWRRNGGVVNVAKTGVRSSPKEEQSVQIEQHPHCLEHPDLSQEADNLVHEKRLAQHNALEAQASTSDKGDHASQVEVAEEDDLNAARSRRRKKKLRHRRANRKAS